MLLCDINCDMGEGMDSDELIMPFISSANIACGFHAGDEATMHKTVLLAKKYNVAVGAHPSFFDRENFGRTEMQTTPEEVYQLAQKQIKILKSIAAHHEVALHHVKPHGALYNMAARDVQLANAIARAIKDYDEDLILYGLSGSYLISEATNMGLKTRSEVFADRTYQDDGSLTPRSQSNALIKEQQKAIEQVLQMVNDKTVTTVSGKSIPIVAETICIHGDSEYAVEFARAVYDVLRRVNGQEQQAIDNGQ